MFFLVERLVILLRTLNGEDGLEKRVLEGSLYTYQIRSGQQTPVLSMGCIATKEYSGMWMERLHHWMSRNDITVVKAAA